MFADAARPHEEISMADAVLFRRERESANDVVVSAYVFPTQSLAPLLASQNREKTDLTTESQRTQRRKTEGSKQGNGAWSERNSARLISDICVCFLCALCDSVVSSSPLVFACLTGGIRKPPPCNNPSTSSFVIHGKSPEIVCLIALIAVPQSSPF